MAIEIKELVIKFSVVDKMDSNVPSENRNGISREQMKEIVEQCKEKVLEKLTKLSER